ncbi:MAG: protein-L-isoaspartate(D-aspartate) O-methyltransferase [Prevotellaceae bacterium]|jgi:protein-L-isoaspartate(D-aspartate) O-methyltransferase|nr:protein-L-isoaspartate(D-aspartate) O-methyltransferase [Prevotellaceae bacterium]
MMIAQNTDFKHIARRRALVEELKKKGISDENVLRAIEKVPRHLFFNPILADRAYEDKAFPIDAGQTISQPYTVAFQSQLLQLQAGEKVLEIGTGSGYQCAVLLEMGAKVYTIERQETLFNQTFKRLHQLGYRATMKFGDGYQGWAAYAPFNKIIITAAAPETPPELLKQLDIGGIMVIPVGEKMLRICRVLETEYSTENVGEASFVPMLEGVN